jgi:TRAP-type mannitol/chloroaromatic compound transport system substrate-binding protein
MDRRKALQLTGSGGLGAILATSTAPAFSQNRKEWRMQQTWGKTAPGLSRGGNVFAEYVTKATNGSLTIREFSAGEIVPPFQTMDAVANGTIQMGYGYVTYWAGQIPAMNYLGTLPFGLTAQEHNAWFSHGGGNELAEKLYAKLGVKFFFGGNTPVQPAGWYNKEIKDIADYKGLKMRIGGLGGKVLQALGGTPVSMPLGEVPQAMQSGAIDAIEFVGPVSDLSVGLHKVAKFYYWPGWLEPSGPYDFFINEKAWATLSPTEQEIVRAGARLAEIETLSNFWARNAAAYNQMVGELKVQVRQIPDDALGKIAATAWKVVEAEAKDADSKEVLASVMKFRRDILPYMRVSELDFMRIRSQVKFG